MTALTHAPQPGGRITHGELHRPEFVAALGAELGAAATGLAALGAESVVPIGCFARRVHKLPAEENKIKQPERNTAHNDT